jgi:putative ABC transport system ATP-binding protein
MMSITLEAVVKRFALPGGETVTALEDVSLTCCDGSLTILVGPNGSGKSTLLHILAGDLHADRGTVTAEIDGLARDWTRATAKERSRWISRIWQDPGAGSIGDLTIEENLGLATLGPIPHPLRRAVSRRSRSAAALVMGDSPLASKLGARSDTLSGGQRQLLAIEMAAARRSRVLLMDEPTASLDGRNAAACMVRAAAIARRGAIVVVVTHDMALAAAFGDRLLVVQRGRIVHDIAGAKKTSLTASAVFDLAAEPISMDARG